MTTGMTTGGTTTGGITPTTGNSVFRRGGDPALTAHWVEPMLTQMAAKNMAPDTTFMATFTGALGASPIYVEPGPAMAGCPGTAKGCVAMMRPAGAGIFIAATEQNMVYALDESTGAMVWTASAGTSPGTGDRCCGQGILSTPASDGMYVYTSGGIKGAGGQSPDHFEVHAFSVTDGTERAGWPVVISGTTLPGFTPGPQNQRTALNIIAGIIYIGFGGYYGDGGNYKGWVAAVDTTQNPPKLGGWHSGGTRQEGIWEAGGLPSDGTSIFAVTGNGQGGDHGAGSTDAEEVIKLGQMSTATRDAAHIYYPTAWQQMDGSDKDFGANSAVYVGSSNPPLLIAPAKPGIVYFLNATKLGNFPMAGGEISSLVVAQQGAESVYTAPTAYPTASGLFVAINASQGAVCGAGGPGHGIMGISVSAGAATPKIAWCAGTGGGNQANLFPISTSTDAMGSNPIVWFMNYMGNILQGVDGVTGMLITSGGMGTCTGMHNMSTPISVKGRIVAGGDGHLCSWSPH
jgi:hypothetical protein